MSVATEVVGSPVIQTRDGLIHCVYSYFVPDGKSMKHAVFNESWIRQEPPTS